MILKDKNVVITGALKGIGREAVEVFASNGSNVWACCINPDIEFENDMQILANKYSVHIECIYFDMSDDRQIKEAAKKIVLQKKSIDGLLNIAGITYNAFFHMTTIETFRKVFEVNVFGQILFTQMITKSMVLNRKGSVVFVSSVSGIDGNYGQTAYGASKSALIGLTKSLAYELSSSGIRINCIAPGIIETDMVKDLKLIDYEKLTSKIISGRTGSPKEVADTCAFLISDMSSYINGQVIRIDGFMQ